MSLWGTRFCCGVFCKWWIGRRNCVFQSPKRVQSVLDFKAQNSSSNLRICWYLRFRSFLRFRRKRELLLQRAFWISFRHARNRFFLLKILPKTSWFQIFFLLVNSLRARMVLSGWECQALLTTFGKNELLNHMVLRWKGWLHGWGGEGRVFMRMGLWLEEVLRKWTTLVSSKRSCQEGLQRALSSRFITSLESFLFFHMKWGPL